MTPGRSPRLGIFGGTFDPPHLGHLIVARDAAEALALDRVLFVLSARPPHKAAGAPEAARMEMLQTALAGDPLLVPSDVEIRRGGPSYTVDTLRELKAREPEAELFLLIGVDQWRSFASWKDPRGVGGLTTVAVMARSGEAPQDPHPGTRVPCTPVPVTRVDISSTDVRERVRQGRSIRYLVPDGVESLIEGAKLYRGPAVEVTLQAGVSRTS